MTDVPNPGNQFLPVHEALRLLAPNAIWSLEGDDLENLRWESDPSERPHNDEIIAKAQELKAAAPMRMLRRMRDARMKEVDWVTLRAVRTGMPIPMEWQQYMQALADITTTSEPMIVGGQLVNVEWPVRPDGVIAGQGRYGLIR